MNESKLTKQDEDISAPEFTAEEDADRAVHGNWPELAGVILTVILLWLTFAFTG